MKIVVLDDSVTVLLTIEALLEELGVEDDDILTFNNGREAIDYIETKGADIIFSDIQMPGMDGFEFVDKLLTLSEHYVSTLFIVSADENFQNIRKMKNIGAKRFIRKPINSKHFNHFVGPEIAKAYEKESRKTGQHAQMNDVMSLKQHETLKSPDYSDLDYEALAQEMGIKPKHIPMLVKSFLDEAIVLLEKLEKAIEEKNYPQIAQFIHSIKGSAGNMKLDDLYEMGKIMELAANESEADFGYKEYCLAIKAGVLTLKK